MEVLTVANGPRTAAALVTGQQVQAVDRIVATPSGGDAQIPGLSAVCRHGRSSSRNQAQPADHPPWGEPIVV
jgi:hypothetical protein